MNTYQGEERPIIVKRSVVTIGKTPAERQQAVRQNIVSICRAAATVYIVLNYKAP